MFKQITHTFITRGISSLFNLVIAIIISNYLGAQGKGEQGLILTTISIVVIFSSIVGSGGLTYLVPRYQLSLLIVPSLIWLITVVFCFHFLMPVLNLVPNKYILDVSLLCIISVISQINISILLAHQRIYKANHVAFIQIVFIFLGIIYLFIVQKKLEVDSYINSLYIGYGASFILSFVYIVDIFSKSLYKFSLKKYLIGFRNLFKYGFYNQLDIIAQLLSFRFAYYILNHYASEADVGVYSNGVSLIESIWLISRSISMVLHARVVNSKNKAYSFQLTLSMIKVSLILSLMLIIPLVLLPSQFYTFIFGNDFSEVNLVIISLSPGILLFTISLIISSYFSGIGKHYINTIASIVGLAVTLAATFTLIPWLGYIGAGIAATFSYASTTIVKIIYYSKDSKIKFIDIFPKRSDLQLFKNEIVKKIKK